jgi:predicted nucleic acid-binding protein
VLQATRREIVTTNLVVAESHALIARRAGVMAGLEFWELFALSAGLRLVWADAEITHQAVERWVRRYSTRILSMTDAVSFEVMRREQVPVAFSYDRDFLAAGFELLKT